MTRSTCENDKLRKNTECFTNELKIFINQKLFDKKIISEAMYRSAKETLLRQVRI